MGTIKGSDQVDNGYLDTRFVHVEVRFAFRTIGKARFGEVVVYVACDRVHANHHTPLVLWSLLPWAMEPEDLYVEAVVNGRPMR